MHPTTQTELALPRAAWLYPIIGLIPYSPEGELQAKGDVRRLLQLLNTHLADKTFLVGERISLADIIVFCTCVDLYKNLLPPTFRASFGNTTRWFQTIANQPEVAVARRCWWQRESGAGEGDTRFGDR